MANITIVQAIQQVAQAGKDYTDKIAAGKVDKISGKGLSTNDLTNDLLANYNAAYTHSQAAHAPSNAQPNQNAFSNFTVGSTTIAADSATDTLTIVAGSNITLTPDATNDKITITATDTVYTHPSSHAATMITEDSSHRFVTDAEKSAWNAKASTSAATTSANGLMTSAMVTKLNGIADNANNYVHPTSAGNKHIPAGGSSGQYLQWSAAGTAQWATITPASIGVEQISDEEVASIISTVFGA